MLLRDPPDGGQLRANAADRQRVALSDSDQRDLARLVSEDRDHDVGAPVERGIANDFPDRIGKRKVVMLPLGEENE